MNIVFPYYILNRFPPFSCSASLHHSQGYSMFQAVLGYTSKGNSNVVLNIGYVVSHWTPEGTHVAIGDEKKKMDLILH